MAPHSSTLAWKIPWTEDLVGCSPWGREELDTTEQLHFHFSLSCTGEGNGNPLQCCCLENPRDRGAWWAAVYGVSQSWTRLKWRSSSSYYLTNCQYKWTAWTLEGHSMAMHSKLWLDPWRPQTLLPLTVILFSGMPIFWPCHGACMLLGPQLWDGNFGFNHYFLKEGFCKK